MPMPCNTNSWTLSSIAIGLLAMLTGCDSSPSMDYRVIDQSATTTVSVEDGLSRDSTIAEAESAADAMKVENGAMMSIRPEASSSVSDQPASALAIANPLKVELLVPNKTFSKDRKTGALRLTFDDINLLTVLNMDPVTDDAVSWMPEWMTSLEGQMVRVRGFMYPTFYAEGLETFVLLKDNQKCCYGPGAKIYDHIWIEMKPGATANYVPLQQSLDVVGRFKIDLQSANGSVYGLYVIEDASVISR